MFSIMMTVESTTMPKSTAPSEIRLAGGAGRDHAREGDEQRERDVERGDERRAQVPRNRKSTTVTRIIPTSEVLHDRVRRQLHQIAAVVVRDDVHPGRQEVVLRGCSRRARGCPRASAGLAAVAHEHDALHHVGLVVVADDAEARRGAHGPRRRRRARGRGPRSARRRRCPRCRARRWIEARCRGRRTTARRSRGAARRRSGWRCAMARRHLVSVTPCPRSR